MSNLSVKHPMFLVESTAPGSLQCEFLVWISDYRKGGDLTQNQIALASQREQARHNLAYETETNRANLASETETNRHNLATETETARNNRVTSRETKRHNKTTERETKRNNRVVSKETHRANTARETLQLQANLETQRHNVESENISHEINQLNKYIADLRASTDVKVAAISANAHVTAASIAASATKYAADVQKLIAYIHSDDVAASNASREQIAEADRLATTAQKIADRVERAREADNQAELERQAQKIKKLQAEAMRDYYQNKINTDLYNAIMDTLNKTSVFKKGYSS